MPERPASPKRWTVLFTAEARVWFTALPSRDKERMTAAVNRLQRHGPALGRPSADSIRGSRHRNMKELRSTGGNLRALFAFDPRRQAIVLAGGDKTNDWKGWYRTNIPKADRLFDRHLRDIGGEGRWRGGGRRSDGPTL